MRIVWWLILGLVEIGDWKCIYASFGCDIAVVFESSSRKQQKRRLRISGVTVFFFVKDYIHLMCNERKQEQKYKYLSFEIRSNLPLEIVFQMSMHA